MNSISSSASGDLTPDVQQNNDIVNFRLNPAQADALFRSIVIARSLSRSDRCFIKDSSVLGLLWNGAGTFRIDLSKAIGSNLTMSFLLDPRTLKRISLLTNTIIYLTDNAYSGYEVTDREHTLFFGKCFRRHTAPAIPSLGENEMVGVPVSIKNFKQIKATAQFSSNPYSVLEIYKGQLTTVKFPGIVNYLFDPAAYRECIGNPDGSLKSFSLMMTPGDEVKLGIFTGEGAYWLKVEAEIAIGATVELFEKVSTLDV